MMFGCQERSGPTARSRKESFGISMVSHYWARSLQRGELEIEDFYDAQAFSRAG